MPTTNSPERPADVAVDAYLVNATMRPRHDVTIVDGTPARYERACDQAVAHVKADFDTTHCYRACQPVNGWRVDERNGGVDAFVTKSSPFLRKDVAAAVSMSSVGADLASTGFGHRIGPLCLTDRRAAQ
jgi:hypothetical protein